MHQLEIGLCVIPDNKWSQIEQQSKQMRKNSLYAMLLNSSMQQVAYIQEKLRLSSL